MPDFTVFTRFRAQDQLSGVYRRMGTNSQVFGDRVSRAFDRASRAFDRASRSSSRFRAIVGGILTANIVQVGLAKLREGIGAVTGQFVEFDHSIVSAAAKFPNLDRNTRAGAAMFERLRKTARQVGADTQFTAAQAAGGLDYLAMAGFDARQAMATLPGVVDLATVANVDLARSTDIASDSLGAFGLMTKDSGKLQANFTRLNDVMAKTMVRSNTNIEDLFESIKNGAPTFTSTGQSLETFNALVGIMANSGVKGEKSGIMLRNVMLRLADPTKEAAAVLGRLGIVTKDSSGNFRDVVDILADFEKGLKGYGTQQRAAALATVFGVKAVTGVNVLLKAGTKQIRGFRTELMGAAGASKQMADQMRGSLQNRLATLKSSLIELGFRIIDAFERQAPAALDRMTAAVRRFDPEPIITGLKITVALVRGLYQVLEPFIPLLPVIVAGMVAYSTALKVQMALGAAKSFLGVVKAIRATSGAMGVLNAVMAANPIGVVVAAATALVGLMVALEQRFQVFTKLVDKFTVLRKLTNFLSNQIFGAIEGKKFADLAQPPAVTTLAAAPVTPPNRREAEARRQNIRFDGRLQIAGAPAGSTVSGQTAGAPAVQLDMMGANP